MDDKIFLTPNDILEKEFKIDARGYRPQEVDKFLDVVISDYTEFMDIIKKYNKEYNKLEKENAELKNEIRSLKSNLELANSRGHNNNKNVTNVDILRRLSELEKVVYGEK
jgi:DivIVA domain-containing protein